MPRYLTRLRCCAGAWEPFRAADGTPFYLNTFEGSLSLSPPAPTPDMRGGLLCDEPGMGKTITVIALMLKSLRADAGLRHVHEVPPTPVVNHVGVRSRRWRASEEASPRVCLDSDATLIVCPSTMVDHWAYQIMRHTHRGALRVATVIKPSQMPSAAEMASLHVVVTTFDVLSKEYGLGSPAVGSKEWYGRNGTPGRGSLSWRYTDCHAPSTPSGAEEEKTLSSLAQVEWKRVVLDEGHVMGASSDSNKALMCARMQCGARWICTGTPTPSTPGSALGHLQGLFAFLNQEPFKSSDVGAPPHAPPPMRRCAECAPRN